MPRTPTRFPTHGSECKALLAACHREPDDDTPRLVLADWLEEHDDPRGELMRLQVRLHAMSAGDPEYDAVFEQHQKWWRKYQNVWRREVGTLLWDAGPHDRGLPTIGHYAEGYARLEAIALGEPSDKPRDRVSALIADGWPGMTWVVAIDPMFDDGHLSDDDVSCATFHEPPWPDSPTPLGVCFPAGIPIAAGMIDEAADVPNLRGLALPRWNAAPDLLPRVAKIKRLAHLDLGNMRLNDAGVATLAPLRKSLRTLIAPGSNISNAGAARLAQFTELRELRLGTRRLSAAGFQALAKLSKLEVLELAKADDKAVAHLAPLQRLRRLELISTACDTTGRGLEAFPLLTHLNLEGSHTNDDGLASVAQLPRLQFLRLMRTRITGAGLVHLAGLRWLETLSLSQLKKVGSKALVHLEGLKNLRHLDLFGTGTTMPAVRKLQKKLKYVTIQR